MYTKFEGLGPQMLLVGYICWSLCSWTIN